MKNGVVVSLFLGGVHARRLFTASLAIVCVAAGLLVPAVDANAVVTNVNPTGVGVHPSPGCRPSGSEQSVTLRPVINAHRRLVIVHLPPNSSANRPMPLVLNLHGSGADALKQEALSGMDATADSNRFIVAYPQGLVPYGSGTVWNVPGVSLVAGGPIPTHDVNDVSFLLALVTLLETKYCLDTNRVYASGYSRGARMASQLACDGSTVFAAVAVISGLRRPLPCPTRRPVSVVAFHGTADAVNSYGGSSYAWWTYSVPSAAQRWGVQDRCTRMTSTSGNGYELVQYSGCRNGTEVELYSIIGEGHEWPGGPTLPTTTTSQMGPQSNAVSANAIVWSFFLQHPMNH